MNDRSTDRSWSFVLLLGLMLGAGGGADLAAASQPASSPGDSSLKKVAPEKAAGSRADARAAKPTTRIKRITKLQAVKPVLQQVNVKAQSYLSKP